MIKSGASVVLLLLFLEPFELVLVLLLVVAAPLEEVASAVDSPAAPLHPSVLMLFLIKELCDSTLVSIPSSSTTC